jgi:hypothetical protein
MTPKLSIRVSSPVNYFAIVCKKQTFGVIIERKWAGKVNVRQIIFTYIVACALVLVYTLFLIYFTEFSSEVGKCLYELPPILSDILTFERMSRVLLIFIYTTDIKSFPFTIWQ